MGGRTRRMVPLLLCLALGIWTETLLAQSSITADGVIESTSGGFRFPDASVQTTAAAGGGAITNVYKEVNTNLSVGTTATPLGLSVAAPATGTYLIMANIQGFRDGSANTVTFEITVNGTVETPATRRKYMSPSNWTGPIPLLHRASLTIGDAVEVQATSNVADSADVDERTIILLQLD